MGNHETEVIWNVGKEEEYSQWKIFKEVEQETENSLAAGAPWPETQPTKKEQGPSHMLLPQAWVFAQEPWAWVSELFQVSLIASRESSLSQHS